MERWHPQIRLYQMRGGVFETCIFQIWSFDKLYFWRASTNLLICSVVGVSSLLPSSRVLMYCWLQNILILTASNFASSDRVRLL